MINHNYLRSVLALLFLCLFLTQCNEMAGLTDDTSDLNVPLDAVIAADEMGIIEMESDFFETEYDVIETNGPEDQDDIESLLGFDNIVDPLLDAHNTDAAGGQNTSVASGNSTQETTEFAEYDDETFDEAANGNSTETVVKYSLASKKAESKLLCQDYNYSVADDDSSDGKSKLCYLESDDQDKDGYARSGADSQKIWVSKSGRLTCPCGYVSHGNDCNDEDKNIYPKRGEIAFNNVDDNCNESVDEAEFFYSALGVNNTSRGFDLKSKINDFNIIKSKNRLYVILYVSALSNYSNIKESNHIKVSAAALSKTNPYIRINVKDMTPGTVYRAKLRFYERLSSGTYRRIGATSSWYYTTTLDTNVAKYARNYAVLKGLKEFDDSHKGLVGYMGTKSPNGTRYHADNYELWCSEFYSWVVGDYFGDFENKGTVASLVEAFGEYFVSSSKHSLSNLVKFAQVGDYIPMDTDDDGKANHSAMYLAYDSQNNTVWTLEGNFDNNVQVIRRSYDRRFKGFGRLPDFTLDADSDSGSVWDDIEEFFVEDVGGFFDSIF
ncbi:MAG: putative metal-binding motif-containing protein [Deltaproteobacteria bacterium]|nr:putative metal-binding motif-containing protein [Deltaproteobacteria bacterium]